MKVVDRLLFLKYALPCSGAFVKRGEVSQEHINNLVKLVSEDKVPNEAAESMFKVANVQCEAIAKRMGKDSIDAEVIRQYFLLEHNKVVDETAKLVRDFNPAVCKTYAGRVAEVDKDSALVETSIGKRRYKILFVKDIKKNDMVSLHYDFVIECISKSLAEKMNALSGVKSGLREKV